MRNMSVYDEILAEPEVQPETVMLDSADKGPQPVFSDILNSEVELGAIRDYMEIERPTTEENERMGFIYQWARENGAEDDTDALAKIGAVERRLGSPHLGESRLARLYQWVSLDMEAAKIFKAQRAYER